MSLTVAFITSREKPELGWFLDSLVRQSGNEAINVIVIWTNTPEGWDHPNYERDNIFISYQQPKPTVWQGLHRLTKSDWWAKSNALNTALCLCRTDYLASVDDRCVLAPGWLDSVREAMAGRYSVCGAYEKRVNMRVENGEIIDPGTVTGTDHRLEGHLPRARYCIPGWFFGCSFALPTEWALQVNGWNELLDGLGTEDTHFGSMLGANGFETRFDPRMLVIQDRTPEEIGPVMKRDAKARFVDDKQDKAHKAIKRFSGQKQSSHHWNIREIRDKVMAGGEWPGVETCPTKDWFDGQPLLEFA